MGSSDEGGGSGGQKANGHVGNGKTVDHEASEANGVEQETTDGQGRKVADSNDGDDEEKRKDQNAAALVLQRNYRGHQTRNKMNGVALDKSERWDDLLNQTKMKTASKAQDEGHNDPASRWRRSLAATQQLQRGDGVRKRSDDSNGKPANPQIPEKQQGSDGRSDEKKKAVSESAAQHHGHRGHERPHNHGILTSLGISVGGEKHHEPKIKEPLGFQSKQLEETQWLEMVDGKHRYGSNLKYYHKAWQEAETKDNFYRWLDHGDGKTLDLPECPRKQLEKERITYLSAEQRLNYLVLAGDDGRLRWAHNDELVDTSPNHWADAGHGEGIIPKDAASKEQQDQANEPEPSSDSSSISSSDISVLQENQQTHYTDDNEDNSTMGKLKQRFTLKGAGQKMLRKTVSKNTWIYVSDLQYNLFIGMKTTGTFQHSSFLSGGQVTCAGVIQCRDGKIQSLSPLSGHYRGSIDHYKAFIAHLDEIGVDLSKVRVGKAEATMWGIQQIGKVSKKKKTLVDGFKHALHIKTDHRSTEEKSEDQKRKAEGKPKTDRQDGKPDGKRKEQEDTGPSFADFKKSVFYGRQDSDAKPQDRKQAPPGTSDRGRSTTDGKPDAEETESSKSAMQQPHEARKGLSEQQSRSQQPTIELGAPLR